MSDSDNDSSKEEFRRLSAPTAEHFKKPLDTTQLPKKKKKLTQAEKKARRKLRMEKKAQVKAELERRRLNILRKAREKQWLPEIPNFNEAWRSNPNPFIKESTFVLDRFDVGVVAHASFPEQSLSPQHKDEIIKEFVACIRKESVARFHHYFKQGIIIFLFNDDSGREKLKQFIESYAKCRDGSLLHSHGPEFLSQNMILKVAFPRSEKSRELAVRKLALQNPHAKVGEWILRSSIHTFRNKFICLFKIPEFSLKPLVILNFNLCFNLQTVSAILINDKYKNRSFLGELLCKDIWNNVEPATDQPANNGHQGDESRTFNRSEDFYPPDSQAFSDDDSEVEQERFLSRSVSGDPQIKRNSGFGGDQFDQERLLFKNNLGRNNERLSGKPSSKEPTLDRFPTDSPRFREGRFEHERIPFNDDLRNNQERLVGRPVSGEPTFSSFLPGSPRFREGRFEQERIPFNDDLRNDQERLVSRPVSGEPTFSRFSPDTQRFSEGRFEQKRFPFNDGLGKNLERLPSRFASDEPAFSRFPPDSPRFQEGRFEQERMPFNDGLSKNQERLASRPAIGGPAFLPDSSRFREGRFDEERLGINQGNLPSRPAGSVPAFNRLLLDAPGLQKPQYDQERLPSRPAGQESTFNRFPPDSPRFQERLPSDDGLGRNQERLSRRPAGGELSFNKFPIDPPRLREGRFDLEAPPSNDGLQRFPNRGVGSEPTIERYPRGFRDSHYDQEGFSFNDCLNRNEERRPVSSKPTSNVCPPGSPRFCEGIIGLFNDDFRTSSSQEKSSYSYSKDSRLKKNSFERERATDVAPLWSNYREPAEPSGVPSRGPPPRPRKPQTWGSLQS